MRWWLDDNTNQLSSLAASRRWIITVLNGSASWTDHDSPYGELHFSSAPSALALECQSVLALDPVNMTISPTTKVDWEKRFWAFADNNPPIRLAHGSAYNNDAATSLHDSIAAALDHGLDRANTQQSTIPLVRLRSFVGDFLSWTMYRHRYAACLPPCSLMNSSDLRVTASRLFATYVVAGVATTTEDSAPLLTRPLEDFEPSESIKTYGVDRSTVKSIVRP
jgi:hypothetical protein